MKSFLFIFILFLLNLSNVISDGEGCTTIKSDEASKDKCNKALSDTDKKYYEKCCYVAYKTDGQDTEAKGCQLFTKYKFEHVKDVIKQNQFQVSGTYVLECKANYIKYSLLSLALLFI